MPQVMRISVLALGLLLGQGARAYLCSRVPPAGPSLYWNTREVSFALNAEGDPRITDGSELEASRLSFATWAAVACTDLRFVEQALTSARLVGYNWRDPAQNENLVVWRSGRQSDPSDAWRHEPGSIAVTTTTFKSRSGELLDADVEFNAEVYTFTACTPPEIGCTVQYDVQNTLTHEIGHVIGLDHPPLTQPGVTDTTMYQSAPRGELKKRDLDPDDEEGLCFIYPAGGPAGQCDPASPDRGPEPIIKQVGSDPDTGCVCRGAGATGLAPALLLILLLAVRRRLN
ncbi:MAG: matrixin family metalloprotease [Pseudomonadota bacterium]